MKKTIIIAVGLIVVIALAVVGYNYLSKNFEPVEPETSSQPVNEPSAAREEAPDFTFYNKEGEKVKLSDYKGKPIILNFWASWCGPCKAEMPDFQSVYDENGENIQFIMVNLTDGYKETEDSANKFIADNGYTLPIYFDKDMEGAYTYSVNSVPRTVVIDSDGNIVKIYYSMMNADALEAVIADLV